MTTPARALPFCRLIGQVAALCLLAVSTAVAVPAETPPLVAGSQAPAASTEETQAQTFPGLEQVAPRATELAARAAEAKQLIAGADLSQQLQPEVAALQAELADLEQRVTGWDRIDEWQISRLLEAKSGYLQLQRKQLALQERFSEPLKQLEQIQKAWLEEQAFWQDWQASLKDTWQKAEKPARIRAPREAFARSLKAIGEVIAEATRTTNQLLAIQQDFSAQQETVASRIGYIEGAMETLRQQTFRRNSYSLFSPEFYRQLTKDALISVTGNVESIFRFPSGFLRTQGWIAALQAMAVILIGWFLNRRKKSATPVAEELSFLFKHPWAGGVFMGVLLFSVFYTDAPPLWRWLMTVLTVVPATFLIVSMYRRALLRRIVRALAVIYLLTETLSLIGLPQPMQQIYLMGLCLFTIVACLSLVRRIGDGRVEDMPGLAFVFTAGAVLAAAGLVGELFGFATFASKLVEAVLGTIILLLASHMAIRLSDGAVAAFLQKEWVRTRPFVSCLGSNVRRRLQILLRIFILANVFVYLFVIWDVYDQQKDAIQQMLALKFSVGEFSVTLQMLVLLFLVLYLTYLFSWALQAFAEAHYMTPRKMEFGVKAALKRLLHYALFTIGFFLAISMAGVDLQKFAIIFGALGVGIGFGLQNIVNNFVSGLILLFERPVKVGDMILLDGEWGRINKIGMRSTVVETFDQAEIIVPNSDLISQKVVNWTLSSSVSRLVLPVGVAYGSRLETVLEVLDKVAKQHPEVLDEPAASAIFTGFGNSSIDFQLRVWIADINRRLNVKSELGRAIDEAFRAEGITIPFPQMDLHLKSVEASIGSLFEKEQTDSAAGSDEPKR